VTIISVRFKYVDKVEATKTLAPVANVVNFPGSNKTYVKLIVLLNNLINLAPVI